ncbi:MAG: TPM domain-containing protein [Cyanobacteria bacterium P01_A01_bin.17]
MFNLIPLKMSCAGLVGLVAAASAFPVSAVPINQVPNPRQTDGGWVTDMANLLSDPTETQLNQMISALEAKNGSEIAVVTVPETAPSKSPKAFATELFNTWGIGKKEQDNGILFLISKRDRKLEIETGYGIEPILPNSEVKQIIDSQITPSFKQGNFDRGTLDGTASLIKALQDATGSPKTTTAVPSVDAPQSGWGRLPLLVTGAGLFAISGLLYRRKKQSIRLKPGTRSRTQRREYSDEQTSRTPRCSQCGAIMHKVANSALSSQLTEIEQTAQQLGSIKYLGWKCDCQPSAHVRAYVWNDTAYKNCPHCQELTVTYTLEVLKEATRDATGRQRVIEDCECCDHHRDYEETISRLPNPRYTGASGTAAGSAWIVGSGFTSGGGSSGGGGGFGGGSSGGGGAGGGW